MWNVLIWRVLSVCCQHRKGRLRKQKELIAVLLRTRFKVNGKLSAPFEKRSVTGLFYVYERLL